MINENAETDEKKSKILLIDNYSRGFPTDRIARIETIIDDCIADVELETVHFTQFKTEMVQNYIGVILSGSELNVSSFYFDDRLKRRFNPQLKLIRRVEPLPIFAMCFGLHLVSYAYGAQVARMRILGLGGRIIFINIKKTDDLITQKNIPVNAHHLDFVSPNDCLIQKNFEILSTSRTKGYKMIQYMRHNTRPIFSVQFHPETHYPYYFHPNIFDERISTKARMIGQEILENFVWLCYYNKNRLRNSL
ncbi:MAG: glutamine amidotransferase-related protein [Promethearchaeota archaeon]|jgi:GMP synthase-like glutamine amidotransferase